MRISSQNNQFIFNLPKDFIDNKLDEKFSKLMDKNFIPYLDIIDYINSTIKDIVFPSVSYQTVEQTFFHGKKINWRESGNVMDKFQGELDITFRSVDSHLNYFIILEVLNNYYLNKKNYLDVLDIKVIDKDGDLIYTILLKEVIYKSLSEIRMSYSATDFNEQTFTVTFAYNFIDIIWGISEELTNKEQSIFNLNLDEPEPHDTRNIENAYKKILDN
jgi:hypothetical protein